MHPIALPSQAAAKLEPLEWLFAGTFQEVRIWVAAELQSKTFAVMHKKCFWTFLFF